MELLNPLADANFPTKTVAYTTSAAATGTWPAGPQGVVVWSDTESYIAVGEGATATSSSTPIPAYTPIPFKVPSGTGAPWRVSALQIYNAGNVYAKPINIQ